MKVKVKNRTYRYDTNRTRPRNGYEYTKCNICLSMMMVMQASNTQAISEALFMKKLRNTKAELKKVSFIKKRVTSIIMRYNHAKNHPPK